MAATREGVLRALSSRNTELAQSVLAAAFYGCVSGSMSFLNKLVLSSYSYRHPTVLVIIQFMATALCLEILRKRQIVNIPKYTIERGKHFCIPSVCFALNTTLALAALGDLSIPMYNVLRRLLPLVTLVISWLVLKKRHSFLTMLSVVIVVIGCIIAGLGDLTFNLYGYICALTSVFSQAMYLTYVQKTGVEDGLSALGVLHLNSINCIPLLLLYTCLTGEFVQAFQYPNKGDVGFQVIVCLDILMGCVLNYSLFLCATLNSALTTSLVGVIKGVLTTLIGFFTFGGVPLTFLTVTGVLLNTTGGVCYSYAKFIEKTHTVFMKELCPAREVVAQGSEDSNEDGLLETSKLNGHVTVEINGNVPMNGVVNGHLIPMNVLEIPADAQQLNGS